MRGTRIRYGRRTFEVTALTGQTRGDRAGRLDCGAVGYCQPLYTARRRVKCAMVPGSGEHRERRESRLQAGLLQSSLTSSCDTPKSCQSTQACPVNLRCISTSATRDPSLSRTSFNCRGCRNRVLSAKKAAVTTAHKRLRNDHLMVVRGDDHTVSHYVDLHVM